MNKYCALGGLAFKLARRYTSFPQILVTYAFCFIQLIYCGYLGNIV